VELTHYFMPRVQRVQVRLDTGRCRH